MFPFGQMNATGCKDCGLFYKLLKKGSLFSIFIEGYHIDVRHTSNSGNVSYLNKVYATLVCAHYVKIPVILRRFYAVLEGVFGWLCNIVLGELRNLT